ncbi:MAG: hypothetical protein ABI622_01355 [Chloroflexota bacterium]
MSRPSSTVAPTAGPTGALVDDPAHADFTTVLEHGTVGDASTTLFVTTDGGSVVFSGASELDGQARHAPDLLMAVPGQPPRVIFHNPRRQSDLIPVAAGGGYLAFGEGNVGEFGPKGWVLWLLPPGGSEPFELDRNPATNEAPLPLVTINESHAAWQAIGFGPELERAELVAVDLPSMTRRVIHSADPQDYQWWDPALDGDLLVYTEVDYVHGDAASQFQPAELYAMLLDLGDASAAPVRLDTSGRATEPAIHGRTVVWKEADNVFAWGTLTIHDLDSGRSRLVATDPQSGIKTPSVGNRYVGFWGIDDTEFYLFDLKRDEMARVFQISPTSEIGGAYRVEVAGDQAVWVQGAPGGSVIAWARLPSRDDP